jgi:hypothetical protein
MTDAVFCCDGNLNIGILLIPSTFEHRSSSWTRVVEATPCCWNFGGGSSASQRLRRELNDLLDADSPLHLPLAALGRPCQVKSLRGSGAGRPGRGSEASEPHVVLTPSRTGRGPSDDAILTEPLRRVLEDFDRPCVRLGPSPADNEKWCASVTNALSSNFVAVESRDAKCHQLLKCPNGVTLVRVQWPIPTRRPSSAPGQSGVSSNTRARRGHPLMAAPLPPNMPFKLAKAGRKPRARVVSNSLS